LPNDPHQVLSVSKLAITVPIKITNTSGLRQIFFADARLRKRQVTSLPIFLCSKTTTLPGICLFTYVPPEVNDAQFVTESTLPITMEAVLENGSGVGVTLSPDLNGRNITPELAAATLRTHEVPWSFWVLLPTLAGPFGPAGAPTAPVGAAVSVNMRPFDGAMLASSGNAYSDLTFGTNTFNPLVLAPGASGVINVTIKPDPSQVGKTVKGFIYLDNFNNILGAGDEVVRIPYEYTVGP
jgi:hypothetical protein